MPISTPDIQWGHIAPELILAGAALALLTAGTFLRSRERAGASGYAIFTVAAALAAIVACWGQWQDVGGPGGQPSLALADAIVLDGFGVFLTIVICAAVALGALVADSYLHREGLERPDFFVLMLLSGAGGVLMAKANDLILIFLGLEILSIALYVLAGYHRRRSQSLEAAIKYFVLGAFSSAFFLYGIALTYGSTGSTNLGFVAEYLRSQTVTSGVLLGGMALLLVGLGFKVAAVPFHMWTPDVYQGSPTPVTGFMAGAAKAAGFAALLRIFFTTFGDNRLDWQPLVWAVAVLTLVVGSVLAIVQSDVKRMLAYSSISHAGYVLVGLQAASERGIAGSLFYLMAYTFMVAGTFAIVTVVGRRGDDRHSLDDYRGLAKERPGLALAFTVLLLAQAGVPLTSGFLAKFYVISAAVESESYALALVAMVAAVIAAFLYLRIVLAMYTGVRAVEAGPADGDGGGGPVTVPATLGLALGLALVFTLAAGVFPDALVDFARDATALRL